MKPEQEGIDERELEQVVLTRLVRLNATIQGILMGLFFGGMIFVATNWLILKGGPVVGPHLSLLGQFFPGYAVTFAGSLIGFGYGLLVGFVTGYVMATVYNALVGLREARNTVVHRAQPREENASGSKAVHMSGRAK